MKTKEETKRTSSEFEESLKEENGEEKICGREFPKVNERAH